MQKHLQLFICLLALSLSTNAQFEDYFISKTLRIDYQHAGNNTEEFFFLDQVKIEPHWGGSRVNLVDTFEYGRYFFKLFDIESDSVLYSRGYSSLFGEWQTTAEAEIVSRSFHETIVMPLPLNRARIEIYSRNEEGIFEKKFSWVFHPDDYFINPDPEYTFSTFDVHISGKPEKKVDIIILPEGYTQEELGSFISDCRDFADHLFTFEPFGSYQDRFNVRGVLAPSRHSGSDIPADSVWKKTILGTNFYTFDSERYLMTLDNKSVRDLAASGPYDQIYILVNTTKYGGGAIYNYYSVSVNSNERAAKIFVHEFGHGFAGLADEYYSSSTSYNDFYSLKVEPWEPNITTLVDFDSKWKSMIGKKIPVPTPDKPKYYDKTGVFEGGGYVAKGVYRPAHDCLMKSFQGDHFCQVCRNNIVKMIEFYSE